MHYIYLHGFTSGPASFKAQYFSRQLADMGIKLYVPDLNGEDFQQLTLSSQLNLITNLCGQLSGPLTLIGSSLGGYLAALYAEREMRVERIIMMAPAFRFVTRHFERMPEEKIKRWQSDGVLPVYHHFYQQDRLLNYGLIEDAANYDQTPLQRELPALLFHGRDDETVPWELSEHYREENPLAAVHILEDDHGLARSLDFMWETSVGFLGLEQIILDSSQVN